MKARRFTQSIGYALEGLWYAYGTQRNLRIHTALAVVVFLAAYVWNFAPWELAVLLLTTALVIGAELLNTAIEVTVDLFTSEYHHLARTAKNVAAGTVLVTAFNALLIGFILFGPRLAGAVQGFFE